MARKPGTTIEGVRTDLVKLWRRNTRLILLRLNETETRLAEKCGISVSSISMMLQRDDYRLTTLQLLGTMHALQMLILEHEFNREAWNLWNEVHKEYSEDGLK